jgi:hypothetical protein
MKKWLNGGVLVKDRGLLTVFREYLVVFLQDGQCVFRDVCICTVSAPACRKFKTTGPKAG